MLVAESNFFVYFYISATTYFINSALQRNVKGTRKFAFGYRQKDNNTLIQRLKYLSSLKLNY